MGFFSKKNKPKPSVETQGLRIEYDPESETWQFNDKEVSFVVYGSNCVVPSLGQIASIHADIDRLRPEMIRRLGQSKEIQVNDGETYFVNITDLHESGNYGVSWSGGESWGDMGVDFTISNHEITDEAWGD